MNLVNPLEIFAQELNTVQSPSRYLGGEYGIIKKEHTNEELFNFGIAFPDLYEIAMSNLAIKIIYNALNKSKNIRCERVFAPDLDFENLLKKKNVPLYTLETGIPLNELDILSFSIGYELGATEVLAMLEDGHISILADQRSENEPIVIAGGCGVTNPAPFSLFFDAIMIGEAENALFELVEDLALMKKNGSSRKELLDYIKTKPFMWTPNQSKISYRHVQNNFGLVPSVPDWFPLTSSKPIQDHGVVEIMRGCPNGCRFCHAGIYYRPMRVKNLNLIIEEIDHLVFDAGYREISLNSLSSADFPNVGNLLDILNERYKGYNVSFQLPSLKVNSMSLDILEKLNRVRKSGLTFAVETPDEMAQLSLNKEVYAQHLVEIIKEAKLRGWSSAKFYFMIGLPVDVNEEETIVNFLLDLQSKTKIQCNVNVGVFVPKPHTPYQWVKQISSEDARRKIDYLYKNLPRGKFKIGHSNYDAPIIEGLLSRGDKRCSEIIYNVYKKGARFDSWDDYLKTNMTFWNEAFEEASWNVKDWIYKDWSLDEELPWGKVSLGPSKNFYKREFEKSKKHELTKICEHNCKHNCGVCNSKNNIEVYSKDKIESALTSIKNSTIKLHKAYPECNIPILYRVIFKFSRKNGAEFISYLSQVEIFHKAILRSKLPIVFTVGFNPLPRLEFASAMTLGIPSEEEIASCLLYENFDEKEFVKVFNSVLPENLHLTQAFIFPITNLRKRESLSQGMFGSQYKYEFFDDIDFSSFFKSDSFKEFLSNKQTLGFSNKILKDEIISNQSSEEILSQEFSKTFYCKFPSSDKSFRLVLESFFEKKWFEIAKITKLRTLAKSQISGWTAQDEEKWHYDNKNFVKSQFQNQSNEAISFFDLYKKIAKINLELINQRKEFEKEQKKFYLEHPDLLEKRGIKINLSD